MKKKILIPVLSLLFLVQFLSCQQKQEKDDDTAISADLVSNPISANEEKGKGKETEKSKLPVMEFKTTSHDFGLIVQGEKVANTFKFTNTGGADLIISDASATCGCTIPTYSRKPIKPGEEGEIEVVFNTAGKTGAQHKTISILTNAQPNTIRLEIEAQIAVLNK